MNSSIFSDKKERCAYGIHIETQTNVLLKMVKMMSTMKGNNSASGSVCNFQKGIVLSSHSLMGLYVMLKENFNIEFIMTRKLNQDCLERFFGCIRQMSGPHDHPDSVTFKKRLKKYVLGKDARLLSDKNNVGQDNDDGKCLREVMTNSKIKDSYDRELDLRVMYDKSHF